MRVAIDISQIIYGTGVSTYTKELIENLVKIDSVNEYLLFGASLKRRSELDSWINSVGEVKAKTFMLPSAVWEFIGNTLHFPKIESLIGPIDVYHSSDWVQYPSRAYKVTTVHDLAPIFLKRITNKKIVEVHKRRIGWVLKEVDKTIVPSNATKMDLIKLGAAENRVVVIPEAPGSQFAPQPTERIEEVKKKYGLRERYCLAIGVNERKNTRKIMEAFVKAKRKDLKLVVVGHKYNSFHEVRGVNFIGHVPTSDLPMLYSGAEVLIYPSLYEGFGLPILEAMSCGCPVVTSNISSMPEVAGDAAVLVDPYDVSSIAEGIKKALKGKVGLVKRGYAQTKKFSWEKTAKMTLEVYNGANKNV